MKSISLINQLNEFPHQFALFALEFKHQNIIEILVISSAAPKGITE